MNFLSCFNNEQNLAVLRALQNLLAMPAIVADGFRT